jgi:hypothetical protein
VVGKGDEMDMVGHQAIGPDFQPILFGLFGQPGKILHPVPGCKENILPVIAPLGDMMGHPGKNDPGLAAHSDSDISKKTGLTRKIVSVPFFSAVFSPRKKPSFNENLILKLYLYK